MESPYQCPWCKVLCGPGCARACSARLHPPFCGGLWCIWGRTWCSSLAEAKAISTSDTPRNQLHNGLLAVVHALKIWQCYLEGLTFTVATDHNPLVHLPTQPNPSGRQGRWSEHLQRFTLEWEYQPGASNLAADAWSRNPPSRFAAALLMMLTHSKTRTLVNQIPQTRARTPWRPAKQRHVDFEGPEPLVGGGTSLATLVCRVFSERRNL